MKKNNKYGMAKGGRDDEIVVWIDKDQLDVEWEYQAERYYKLAKMLAEEKLTLEESKNELEVTAAECKQDIRDNPKAYDIDSKRVTVDAVKDALIQQRPYQDALRIVRNIEHRVDLLKAGVQAMEHRKKALESLVYLEGMNYRSEPRAKDEASREQIDEARERRIAKRNQRKRRKKIKMRRERDMEED